MKAAMEPITGDMNPYSQQHACYRLEKSHQSRLPWQDQKLLGPNGGSSNTVHAVRSHSELSDRQRPTMKCASKEDIVSTLKAWQFERMKASACGKGPENWSTVESRQFTNSHGQVRSGSHIRRRHTLANGIDFDVMEQLKLIEAERNVLVDGLETLELARTWFHRRLSVLDTGHARLTDQTSASKDCQLTSSRNQLNTESELIAEINRLIKQLIHRSDQGFAVPVNCVQSVGADRSQLLSMKHERDYEQQNLALTQELKDLERKMERLESEKLELVREVFQANCRIYAGNSFNDDDTMNTMLI